MSTICHLFHVPNVYIIEMDEDLDRLENIIPIIGGTRRLPCDSTNQLLLIKITYVMSLKLLYNHRPYFIS